MNTYGHIDNLQPAIPEHISLMRVEMGLPITFLTFPGPLGRTSFVSGI
jgi:hypothetical protein